MNFMKTMLISSLFAIVLVGCKGEQKAKLENDDQKTLYSLGFLQGGNLSNMEWKDAEKAALVQGFKDALNKKEAAVKVEDFRRNIPTLMRDKVKKAAEKVKADGKAYLDKFAKEEGAQKTESGLAYKITKEGTGAMPKETDTVKVHYHGTLVDGTVFDSSVDRGQPISFPLNRVIKGWTEGLQKVKQGGKIKLVIPSDLAYGDGGNRKIPGGSTLIFDVELIEINPKEEKKPMPAGHHAGDGHNHGKNEVKPRKKK
jgi:FKBP-type peptidyl-prolyl cis-trans isomerase FkpA